MVVDWKHLASTKGYKSLKEAMVENLSRPGCYKDLCHKKFSWIISRAKHYALRQGKTLEEVLNEWEENRDRYWTSFYQDYRIPKLNNSGIVKPAGLKASIKYHKRWSPKKATNKLAVKAIEENARRIRTKKPKWSKKQKTGHAFYLKRLANKNL